MMLDADIVAVSPASVWRVLSRAGLLRKWSRKPSKKGSGFERKTVSVIRILQQLRLDYAATCSSSYGFGCFQTHFLDSLP